MMPLTMAKAGEEAAILKNHRQGRNPPAPGGAGLCGGGMVTVVSEMAGSLIVQVKESRVALDRSMANRIMI